MIAAPLGSSLPAAGRISDRLRKRASRHVPERIIEFLLFAAALGSVFTTAAIVYVLVKESWVFFQAVPLAQFLFDTQWTPLFDDAHFAIMVLLSGTITSSAVALLVAIPLGTVIAIYLSEFAPFAVREVAKPFLELLAGVPSIVYGLLALGLFVYEFGLGQSILSAGLTLALLILPVVIVATREAIRGIPRIIREGAYACGATNWQTVRDHILPYSTPGILTGVIIGMARAIGETAPIITIGALTFIAFLPPAPFAGDPPAGPFDWLFAPFTVMPIQMFNWTSRPEAAFQANAAAAGFVLVLMTLAMNAAAIWLRYRLRRDIKW